MITFILHQPIKNLPLIPNSEFVEAIEKNFKTGYQIVSCVSVNEKSEIINESSSHLMWLFNCINIGSTDNNIFQLNSYHNRTVNKIVFGDVFQILNAKPEVNGYYLFTNKGFKLLNLV